MLQGGTLGVRRPQARTAACLCRRLAEQPAPRSSRASTGTARRHRVPGGLGPNELRHCGGTRQVCE